MAKESKPEAQPIEGGEPAKKKPLNKFIILGGAVIIMGIGSYFLQKMFLFSPSSSSVAVAKTTEEKKEGEGKEKGKEGKEGESGQKVITLDEIIVNPADTGGRRYLAMTAGLLTSSPEAEKKIEEQRAVVRDAIISLLSAKHLEELADITYRDSLKTQIKDAVNSKVHGVKIDNIVFSGYVLQ